MAMMPYFERTFGEADLVSSSILMMVKLFFDRVRCASSRMML